VSTNPKIVIVGGGTGSFVVASGLRKHPVDVTVILTMVDDGGSNKTIRDEFGLLPTSGVRQAIVALSENHTVLRKLFTYRYDKGGAGLTGMTFANLFMAAMADIMGSQQRGIEETCKLLNVKGTILPISYDNVRLAATYENGTQVIGEHEIDEPSHDGTLRITKLETQPATILSDAAKKALLEADLIILGPGDFYTNTIANLVVKEMPETLEKTAGKLAFITNLMTKYGETYNFTLKDFIADVSKYISLDLFDYILINNNTNYPTEALELYKKEQAIPVKDDLEQVDVPNATILREDLLSRVVSKKEKGDALTRSMIRHDAKQLGELLMRLVRTEESE
jgi:uncharacterized cofD-like protein